jgi:hypothetical protein
MAVIQLVVRQKNKGPVPLYELVAVAVVWMAQGNRDHRHRTDLKTFHTLGLIMDPGLEVVIAYREVRRVNNFGKHGSDELLGKRTALDAQPGSPGVQGLEKRETHQVIPVGVGEDHVIRVPAFFHQAAAQSPYSGTRIHDNDAIVLGPDFNAGRVAPVFHDLFPRDGDGTPRPPDPDKHLPPLAPRPLQAFMLVYHSHGFLHHHDFFDPSGAPIDDLHRS